jgi:transposase
MRKALSPAELGFGKRDHQRLAKALRQEADVRTFRRSQAVLLVAEGQDWATASHVTGFSQRSLYRFVSRYLGAHQTTALRDRSRAGRPAVAPQVTEARILSESQRLPLQLGYRTNVWTVELLAEHLSKKYRCSISPRTLRRRMKRLGLRCKRPRYVYSEKEPHIAQKKGRLSGG